MDHNRTLVSIVRSVLREGALDRYEEEIGSTGVTYGQVIIPAAAVAGVLAAVNVFIIGPILHLISKWIAEKISERQFEKRERFFVEQRDNMLRVELTNSSSQLATVESVYGGFWIDRYLEDLEAQDGSEKKAFDFVGGRHRINVGALLTGKPHPKSLILNMTGTVDAGQTGEAVGDIRSAAVGFDYDEFGAPFMATHATVRLGDQLLVVPVFATRDYKQVTAVSDDMMGKAKYRPRKS